MVYDIARGVSVVFGGWDYSRIVFDDTWEWDGRAWNEKNSARRPLARYGHAMAYDAARGRVVLFGGRDGVDHVLGDTWEWDGTDWTERVPESAPPALAWAAMVYDVARGRVVLFGGEDGSGSLSDTWEWDGDEWVDRAPTVSPPARKWHAMAYDTARQRTVLFGGFDQRFEFSDTWEWDGSDWIEKNPVGSPTRRSGHSMAYDAGLERIVLFGGGDMISSYSDTWEWDGLEWTEQRPATKPTARFAHTMAYDDLRRRVVLFGGYRGGVNADTWEYGIARHPPTAVVGPDQTLECAGDLQATSRLDGSASSDPDSTPGTNDDIASFDWSENGSPLASGELVSVPFHLGAHDVQLKVTDKAGESDTDDVKVTVQDTLPPTGAITGPSPGACFGPASLPVIVTDDFSDRCDPNLTRVYEPGPGPAYDRHGDYTVTLTVKDSTVNAASAAVSFTIDTVPPVVQFLNPADQTVLVPSTLPMNLLFTDSDDDGATGGVVHEVMKLSGCTIYDGATYGNGDGLLSDESIELTVGELCRFATPCGFTSLEEPVLSVEATDCGGNVGFASETLRGSLRLWPGMCSGGGTPKRAAAAATGTRTGVGAEARKRVAP